MNNEFGAGYDAGRTSMIKVAATAEFLGAMRECDRIIELLEADLLRAGLGKHDKAYTMAEIIALIKEGKE